MTRDEALASRGRYGTVPQNPRHPASNVWTGKVVDVHSSGLYLQFQRAGGMKPRWYHRNDVHLYPLEPTQKPESGNH